MKNCHRLLLFIAPIAIVYSCKSPGKRYDEWGKHKGSDESINYSSLRQLDTSNVIYNSNSLRKGKSNTRSGESYVAFALPGIKISNTKSDRINKFLIKFN